MKDRFIEYIRYEKRYSPHTVAAYESDLSQFQAYLHDQYQTDDVKDITHEMVRSWLVSLKEGGLSSRSINRKLTTLKSWFRFLVRLEVVSSNPVSRVTSLKVSKRLPVFLDTEAIRRLLDEVDYGEGYPGARNRMILELFYATGMRLSELVNLKDSDIDTGQSVIKVLGKRNKERLIPFGHMMAGLLQEYIIMKQDCFPGQDALFLTNSGKPIYGRMVYQIVHDCMERVSTLSRKSPHVMRHTFATHLLNNGAELNAVKELLGHSSLAATQVYTHNAIDKLKRIYEQAHPKA